MSHNRGSVLICLFWLLALAGCLAAQVPQPKFRHFTTDDGLPSSETYVSLEDNEGNMWIGTDNGVARYDGYEFTVFDANDGLEDAVAFTLELDDEGRIWAGTISGRLFYFEEGRFHGFEHNDVLVELREEYEFVHFIDVLSDGSVIVKVELNGIIRVHKDGVVEWLARNEETNYYLYSSDDQKGKYPTQRRCYVSGKPEGGPDVLPGQLMIGDEKRFQRFQGKDVLMNMKQLRPLRVLDMIGEYKGLLVVGASRANRIMSDGRLIEFYFNGSFINHIIPIGDERYWMFSLNSNGLIQADFNLQDKTIQTDTFLNGHSLVMGYIDQGGGLWVNSLNAGVFYCPNPEQELRQIKIGNVPLNPISIVTVNEGGVYAGYENSNIYYHQGKDDGCSLVDVRRCRTGRKSYDLKYDERSGCVMAESYLIQHRAEIRGVNKIGNPFFTWGDTINFNVKEYSEYKNTVVWVGGTNFGTVDFESRRLIPRLDVGGEKYWRYGLESYLQFSDGREFLGTTYGLKEVIKGNELVDNNLGVPELSNRISKIAYLGDDKAAFGTRGSGIVYYAPDTSYIINVDHNLASNQVRNLHVADNGALWVATLEGLTKIVFSKDGHNYTLRTFNTGNGLFDNEVHDIDSRDGKVWLASTAGVYQFLEPPVDSISTPPIILNFTLNGKDTSLSIVQNLKPKENNISFKYGTIIFSLGDAVNYRYRINPDQPWQATQQRLATFPSLAAGDYTFEVQSKNKDGFWSESTLVPLAIARHWYNTWQTWIAGVLVLLGIVFYAFRRREKVQSREQELLLQINRLEHSALHAQMNPHFVFNSLNSIQNFILHNQTREAATYLSRFAALIRQTLRVSVRGQHSLEEEVAMLNGYLGLEKLRFKEAFDYDVVIEGEVSVDTIMLPPLLIQPFVENAILHGLEDMLEGGQIRIRLSGDEKLLTVVITDNGVGIDPDRITKEDSFGMEITKKRLELMSEKANPDIGMDIRPIKAEDGTVEGTAVTLKIKPSKKREA